MVFGLITLWRIDGETMEIMRDFGFPHSSVGKESICNAGNPSSIPGLWRSPGEGKGYPFQYSGLENSIGVTKNKTWLSDFQFTSLIFLGSKVTVSGDYNHENERRLLLRRKAMTDLDSILKSRDITLLTKFRLVKAMAFAVVMYGCESWTIKKAEHWRIDAFELWCWRRLWESLGLQD